MAYKKRPARPSRSESRSCPQCNASFVCFMSSGKRYCSQSCRETAKPQGRRHGESKTRLHEIWCHMKSRCFCKTHRHFNYYGGRGITMCQEWVDSYEEFRDWANANGYTEILEIDRIDVDGDYEPSNCRWATRSQQMANTRKRCDGLSSRFKGVSWCRITKKWKAQLSIDGANTYIGVYKTDVEAGEAYDDKAFELRGEFAFLNFPERKRNASVRSQGIEGVRMPAAGAAGNGVAERCVAARGKRCTASLSKGSVPS